MIDEQKVLEAISAVWDEADEQESEWGFPMKMALRSVADYLGIDDGFYALIRAKTDYLWND